MSLTERERTTLRDNLVASLGEPTATLLMEAIPAMDRNEIATRSDIADLIGRNDALAAQMRDRAVTVDARLDRVDARFDGIDARLDRVDARLDGIDRRFDGMDVRFVAIDARFVAIDARFDSMGERVDAIAVSVSGQIEAMSGRLEHAMARNLRLIVAMVLTAVIGLGAVSIVTG